VKRRKKFCKYAPIRTQFSGSYGTKAGNSIDFA
jgi:hypothetical protein